ncbi:MAG: hypothetical protein WC025_03925 [Candidatus Magasanikbacteria bacterium]
MFYVNKVNFTEMLKEEDDDSLLIIVMIDDKKQTIEHLLCVEDIMSVEENGITVKNHKKESDNKHTFKIEFKNIIHTEIVP